MSVSYEYYKIFYYVAKYKSFNKAASVLSNSQPNISRTITNLEYELGCRLFNRTPRGVTLTDAGKELYAHVEIACEHLRIGETIVGYAKDLTHGTLIIGISIDIIPHITNSMILPVIRQFRETYPDIDLYLINYHTQVLLQNYKEGLIDVAVITIPSYEKDTLEATILHSYRDILVAGSAYSFLKDKTLTLKELAEYPLISLLRTTETYHMYNSFFADRGLEFKPKIEAVHTLQMLSFVTENLGIGCGDSLSCQEYISAGKVMQLKLGEELPLRHIALADKPKKEMSPAAFRFREMLLESLS